MLDLIQSQILFYIAIALVMFLPGYFLLLAVFGKSKVASTLERFIISFGLSIVIVDFIIFLYSKLNISITCLSSIAGILVFIAICFGVYIIRMKRVQVFNLNRIFYKCTKPVNYKERVSNPLLQENGDQSECRHPEDGDQPDEGSRDSSPATRDQNDGLFNFSKNQFILILLLLFLTVFIKTIFLSGSIAPTATDMGHHMYYAKWIADNGKLTDYNDSIINPEDKGKFIIGEHIIFSEIYLITKQSFFSGWPVVILFLINLLSILTVFILTLRIFENKNIAILSLLFIGVLFAVSAPQARYVSGGVLGNIMGNFLMPLAFYFYYRAFEFLKDETAEGSTFGFPKVEPSFLAFAIFTTFGLFYTHHLTGFIFLFVWALMIPIFIIANYKNIETVGKKVLKIIFSPQAIIIFIIGLMFFFFVFTPSYIKSSAVNTAVGTPTKATRTGLNIGNLKQTVGDARLALGFLGLIILAFSFKKRNLGYILTASWAIMIYIMSTEPQLLFVNIPSNRVGNYLTYPVAILSAYGFYMIFHPHTKKQMEKNNAEEELIFGVGVNPAISSENNIFSLIPENLIKAIFLITLTFVIASGISDSAQAFKKNNNAEEAVQTFDASAYLAKNTNDADMILKDHNYLTADSWIKLYFMRDYKYPASRTTLSRYEDKTKPREMCTDQMISEPASSVALDCFSQTKTDFIMVNPLNDSAQFRKLSDFDQVYVNDEVGVYYRK